MLDRTVNALRRLALSLLLLSALSGCGDEASNAPPEDAAPAENAESSKKVATDAPAPAKLMNEIDRHSFSDLTRDPFTPPQKKVAQTPGLDTLADCDLGREPLGATPVERLSLLGLVTGTPAPRAMFRLSGEGQAIIVREGAKVGPRCSGVVSSIRDNEVVILQEGLLPDEQVETIIVLTDPSLQQVQIEEGN